MAETDHTVVLNELVAARAEMSAVVRQIRRRQQAFAALSILTVIFLIGYLGYAYHRFGGDVTPDLVAAQLQLGFQNAMPDTKRQLEQNLKDNAPKVVTAAFDQLNALPEKYTTELQAEASKRLDAAMPAVGDKIYQSMRDALQQSTKATAAAGGQNADDETRLRNTLKSVSDVYAAETMKFIDTQHATYASDALQFTDYLEHLATAQHLDHRDQLHRDMFRTIFALVRARADASATPGDATDTATTKPTS